MIASPFAELLTSLSRHRGVLGAMVVSERDGIAIDAMVQIGINADAIAALAASLHRKARLASTAAGYGGVTFVRLDAERGHLCAAGNGDLVVVAVSEPRSNVGLIRVEMIRAARTLS
jgi:predicted regulator of Ras-like GTPase activity (Roadblock/LC7/MglB family)